MTHDATPSFWTRHLAAGVTVVVPNGRLGSVIRADYDRFQASAGRRTWAAPPLLGLQEWLTSRVLQVPRALGRADLMLSLAQEQALWSRAIDDCAEALELPAGSPAVLARDAQDAWAVQQGYGVLVDPAPVPGESLEQRAFRSWQQRFVALCDELRVVDQSRVVNALARATGEAPVGITCTGFFGASPALRRVLPPAVAGASVAGVQAVHPLACERYVERDDEIAAAVSWVAMMRARQDGTVPVLVYADPTLLPSLEAMLARALDPAGALDLRAPAFRSALPATAPPLIRSALQLFEATTELSRADAAALITSPYLGAAAREREARARLAAQLLARGVDNLSLASLRTFGAGLDPVWTALLALARERTRRQDLKQWLARLEQTLTAAGWPGDETLSAAEEDDLKRWRRVFDEIATLDLVLPSQTLAQTLQLLRRAVLRSPWGAQPTLHAVEILSLTEAAACGVRAARVLGLHADAWPPRSERTPFLSFQAQRTAGVPAVLRERTFELAVELLGSVQLHAVELAASFAAHAGEIAQHPVPGLPLEVRATGAPEVNPSSPVPFEDAPDTPLPLAPTERIRGGASLLTDQAACPFRAFVRHRLLAAPGEQAQLGPDPRVRGDLLHRVLATFWQRHRAVAAVRALTPAARRAAFVDAIESAMDAWLSEDSGAPRTAPAGWLLERARLLRLCEEWLELELARPDFEVLGCEVPRTLPLAPLTLELRIDRIDRLPHGGTLLIDYKSGSDTARSQWAPPRPDQPQLLAYAMTEPDAVGIAFASVRAGECRLLDEPRGIVTAVAPPDPAGWSETRAASAEALHALAQEFAAGTAEVAPKDRAKSCRLCDLHVLCRIREADPPERGEADEA